MIIREALCFPTFVCVVCLCSGSYGGLAIVGEGGVLGVVVQKGAVEHVRRSSAGWRRKAVSNLGIVCERCCC